MAKKKLNKQVAAFAASALIIVVGGGIVAKKLYQGSYRPAQLKAEGRELMLKGDYAGAYNRFQRAAGRLTTDIEFLGWMYDTSLHRTSFSDTALRDARSILEASLATSPNDVPTIVRKLEFDLDLLDAGGLDQFGPDQAQRMSDLAARVLKVEPDNAIALRADAMAHAVPIFKSDTSQTSGDIEAVVTDLRTRLEASPDNADLVSLYALGTARYRETLLRERAIQPGSSDPRVQEMYADVNARVESLLKSLADESKPAAERASGYVRAARIDQIMAGAGFVTENEELSKLLKRRAESLSTAASLVPPTSNLYVPLRLEEASILAQQEKSEEAEAMLRETVAGAPLSWQPRLSLAEFLSERGRPAEALEVLRGDLQPSDELVGLAGYQFLIDRRQIPLRRAFYRLQNLANLKPEDREKDIAIAKADYELALSDGKIGPDEPYALQVQGALQEIDLDRTGAVRTLTRALELATNERLKLRLQQQLVSLNLTLNQPGAASAMLAQMIRNPTLTPQSQVRSVIQLIDLRIKNGDTEQARVLLEQAKRMLPNNPALLALDIKLMADPEKKRTALATLPEDTAPQRFFKLKFAGELEDEPTVRRIAGEMLKAELGAPDASMLLGDYLRRHGKRDEAIKIFETAVAAHPDNKTLEVLLKDTQAVTTEEREALVNEMITDPYKRALYDADRARTENKFDEYVKKLQEAEPLDKAKDGAATERLALYYLAVGEVEKAGQAIDRLSQLRRDPSEVRVLRVRLAMVAKNLGDAIAQANALTSDLPNFSPGWVVKGQVHQLLNQPSQAIDAFETALSQQPESIEALRGLVEAADRAGRRDSLKRYIDQGLRVTNSNEFFTDWSLRYELTFGDPTKTIEPRKKMRDDTPDDSSRWLALAQAYLVSAQAKAQANETTAAADYQAKALEVFKQAAEKFPKAPGFMLEAANLVAMRGDAPGALKMIDEMGSGDDLAPDVQAMRAKFYAEHGQPDAAIKLLQQQVDAGKATEAMRVDLANLLLAQGNTEGALKVLSSAQDTPMTREMRMNIFVSTNRIAEAQTLVDSALAKERSVPNILMAALMQARQGHQAEALKLANEAVAIDGENAAARYTRARIMLSEQPLRNNDLVADLQVVRRNSPNNIDARLLLAERLRALDRVPESVQELELLQRDFPTDRRVVTQLIRAYAVESPPRHGRIDQLLAVVKKQGGPPDPQLLSLESQVALQQGDKARAISAAKAAAQAAPNDIAIYRSMLDAMLSGGANKEVIAEADRIQKENSSLYWTYLAKGAAQHHLKREDEAAKEMDRAIGLALAMKEAGTAVADIANVYAREYDAEAAADWVGSKLPDETATRILQMRLLSSAGKRDKAISVGEQIMAKLDELPRDGKIQILSTMGALYLATSPPRADEARAAFMKLNELEPNNMMTLNNLAYAITMGTPGPSMEEAVGYARKAYELAQANATPNAFIMDTYGWTLVQSGKLDEGLNILQRALEAGALAETEYHIGEVYILKGQKDIALQTLQSALNKAKSPQGGQPDVTLVAHIEDAIRRAETLATP